MLDTASKLFKNLTEAGTPERCGFVLRSGRIVEVSNVHPDPVASYKMDPSDVLSYLKEENPKKQPIATWHTHPAGDPNLSGEDYVGFLHWPEWRHYIVGLRNNKPTVICFEVDGGIVVSTGEFS